MRKWLLTIGLMIHFADSASSQTYPLTKHLTVDGLVNMPYPEGWQCELSPNETRSFFARIFPEMGMIKGDAFVLVFKIKEPLELPLTQSSRSDLLQILDQVAGTVGASSTNAVLNEMKVNSHKCLFVRTDGVGRNTLFSQIAYVFPGPKESYMVSIVGWGNDFSKCERTFHEMVRKLDFPGLTPLAKVKKEENPEALDNIRRVFVRCSLALLGFITFSVLVARVVRTPPKGRSGEYERQYINPRD
jgi:hypothetical protein